MTFELDHDLLNRALEREAGALDALVANLQPHVDRLLRRYVVNRDDRQDVLQTTLIQVVRKLDTFRAESSFTTWIFRVTANEALMMLRSQRRHRARIVPGIDLEGLAALSATRDLARGEHRGLDATSGRLGAELEEALADLPQEDRDLMLARYLLDLDLPELAGRFALTSTATRSRLHRIRGRLRSTLERAPSERSPGQARAARAPHSRLITRITPSS